MDKMLLQYIFPEFSSPHGHMRARVNKKKAINMSKNMCSVYGEMFAKIIIIFFFF